MTAAAQSARPDDVVAFVAGALLELARRAPDQVAVVSVPAEVAVAPWLVPGIDRVWAPPTGPVLAGRGVALEVSASGPERFAAIARRGAACLGKVAERRHPRSPAPSVRLLGGLGFQAGGRGGFAGFGEAHFVLPRLLVGQALGRGFVQIACATPADGAARDAALGELCAALDAVAGSPRVLTMPAGRVVGDDPAGFLARVDQVRAAIARGEAEKIVCARVVEVELERELDLGAAMGALGGRFPDCFRFAHPAGPARFLGASPELLIRRRGDAIESESLAGTAPRGGDGAGLMASGKDRGEQAVVTDAITAALAPLCVALERPAAPEIRELGPVRHLRTPIRGRLRAPHHVLELAALLHPTPAVGGLPRAVALDFLARHEGWRGWYAGCVGWFDGEGDGELAVAIRSALVTGRRAELFAGGGIVAGSDPAAELDETALKLGAMLGALGVAG